MTKSEFYSNEELRDAFFDALDQGINPVDLLKSAVEVKNVGFDPVKIINTAADLAAKLKA